MCFNKHYILKIFLFFIILFALFSCNSENTLNVYEKNFFFVNHAWNTNNKVAFKFTIKDTISLYNIYVILRHTDEYPYNNIWLDVNAISQSDSVQTQHLNLKLGDNNKWLGSIMDDVIEQRVLITSNPVRLKAGDYTFILQQIMRENILQGILNAGIRIEKVK